MQNMMTPEEVLSRLRAGDKRPATLEALHEFYRADRELFFALACVGVADGAEPWAVAVARLAARLRAIVQRGYRVVAAPDGHGGEVQSGPDRIAFEGTAGREVSRFLQELNGTGHAERPGRNYAGTEVSEAEALFGLGEPSTWDAERARVAQRMAAKPLVLRLDESDRRAVVGGMPGYVVHGLRLSATRLVQSAAVMYRGLRREGRLKDGYAFCGRQGQAYDNDGQPIAPPPEMVYVVYADPDGYVFDWDWVREAPSHPGHPIDPELRFTGDPEPHVPEAVIVGVEDLQPAPQFNPQLAAPSPRGDCIFCYFSEEFAFAERINDDLTIFRSASSQEPTGFKIKNVERMLEERRVRLVAPDLTVEVHAFLLASLLRDPDKIEVYSVLIGAWMRRAGHTEPPRIKLPPARRASLTGV